ncbi:hypothetical protein [uncultured Croceicoccus sp.]|uniref:hypothetical protein n=1 Tax=uncultured Croceicoccus sp. TaxID=1295329 RepID=UPI002632DCBA|nr:hypothetical protein [uncultured Croceicoccus sp.]
MLMRLAALGALGYFGYRQFSKKRSSPAYAKGEPEDGVRNAGPEATRDETKENWDETDQALDESFPASDPPAKY